MQLNYSFDGVDCPVCASKIESSIEKLSWVESAHMDFPRASLRLVARDGVSVEDAEREIYSIFLSVENTASIRRIHTAARDDDGPRAFLPPGNIGESLEKLRKAGIEVSRVDEAEGVIWLNTDGQWHELLQKAEAALPGIMLYHKAHEHENRAEDDARGEKIEKLTLITGFAVFLLAFALTRIFGLPSWAEGVAFGVAYIFAAYPVLIETARAFGRRNPFDENFLMSVATVGAFAIGEYAEGVMVMLLYRLGELLMARAVNRSRDSIRDLMALKPDHANLLFGKRSVSVDPALVRIGDEIEIRPGERVPLDGIAVYGSTSLDVSEMTGESAPRDIAQGDEVLSGAINGGGLITMRVTRVAGDSSVARVLNMVEESSSYKARKERIFTRFARVYTPIVCALAVLVAVLPPLFFGQEWYEWIYRGLSFLVVSCPCALVLSIPLSFFGGVGAASRRGVLVKGGECLESLARVDTAVFDKTGTLTEGIMEVSSVQTAGMYTREELLGIAAAAESRMNHPIAGAVMRAAGPRNEAEIEDYENIAGEGVRCAVSGKHVAVGNARLMAREGIKISAVPGTAAYVAVDGEYAGAILLSDRVRETALPALTTLRKKGFSRIVMLTGDSPEAARPIASQLGIDDMRAGLLPDQKVTALLEIAGKGCLFAGDGVNDAPVLAAADVGVAMGGVGTDAAISAADVVLLTDDIGRICDAVTVARKTQVNVYQNITLALGVKIAAMALIALGIGEMWMAVAADAGVAVVCVFNALRLARLKKR